MINSENRKTEKIREVKLPSKYKINQIHSPKKDLGNPRTIGPENHKTKSADLLSLIKTWDKGSNATRINILTQFVEEKNGATGPQLEKEFGNGASLFLLRISAWLRLTYLLGDNLVLPLKAIGIFISAASGIRFLIEFLEVGGVLTILEILTITQTRDNDKIQALALLSKIAHNGRKYKEFICESYGIRKVIECLSKSTNSICQDYCRNLLISLATGNLKFQPQVFNGLQSLISNNEVVSSSIQIAAQCLRSLLPIAKDKTIGIVKSCGYLLKSYHLQVQYEGYELAKQLVKIDQFHDDLLLLLVSILNNDYQSNPEAVHYGNGDKKEHTGENLIVSDESQDGKLANYTEKAAVKRILVKDQDEKKRILSGHIQQSYASKLIGDFINGNDTEAEKLINMGVIPGLLNSIGNNDHLESQRVSAIVLADFVNRFDNVREIVTDRLGVELLGLILSKNDNYFAQEQVHLLRRSPETISKNTSTPVEVQTKIPDF